MVKHQEKSPAHKYVSFKVNFIYFQIIRLLLSGPEPKFYTNCLTDNLKFSISTKLVILHVEL